MEHHGDTFWIGDFMAYRHIGFSVYCMGYRININQL